MKIFSIHHRSTDPAIILSEGLETRFVKEGISWAALFFSPLWLVFHRMWLVLFGAFLLYAAALVAASATGLNPATTLSLLVVAGLRPVALASIPQQH